MVVWEIEGGEIADSLVCQDDFDCYCLLGFIDNAILIDDMYLHFSFL
jgi:hypothetical protein